MYDYCFFFAMNGIMFFNICIYIYIYIYTYIYIYMYVCVCVVLYIATSFEVARAGLAGPS